MNEMFRHERHINTHRERSGETETNRQEDRKTGGFAVLTHATQPAELGKPASSFLRRGSEFYVYRIKSRQRLSKEHARDAKTTLSPHDVTATSTTINRF